MQNKWRKNIDGNWLNHVTWRMEIVRFGCNKAITDNSSALITSIAATHVQNPGALSHGWSEADISIPDLSGYCDAQTVVDPMC